MEGGHRIASLIESPTLPLWLHSAELFSFPSSHGGAQFRCLYSPHFLICVPELTMEFVHRTFFFFFFFLIAVSKLPMHPAATLHQHMSRTFGTNNLFSIPTGTFPSFVPHAKLSTGWTRTFLLFVPVIVTPDIDNTALRQHPSGALALVSLTYRHLVCIRIRIDPETSG